MAFNPSDPAQIMAALEQLNQKIQDLSALSEQIKSQPAKEPKITLPDKFDGNRALYRGFINQLQLTFKMSPSRYASDHVKIATLGSLLKGDALAWYNPFIEHPEKHQLTLSTWRDFLAVMNTMFSDPDLESVAESKIRALSQGRSTAASYSSRFKQLAADLTWNDAALISQLRSGLSNAVKDMLVYQDPLPSDLESFINLTIRLDNRIVERENDKRRASAPPRSQNHHYTPLPSSTTSTPMEIDAIRTKPRGPLTNEERARRFAENLCMYCGGSGHVARNCTKRKPRINSLSIDAPAPDFWKG